MISFLICLAILIGGYFIYGSLVERTFGPDDLLSKSMTAWTTWFFPSGSCL